MACLAVDCGGVTWWLVTETDTVVEATPLPIPTSPLVDDTDVDVPLVAREVISPRRSAWARTRLRLWRKEPSSYG